MFSLRPGFAYYGLVMAITIVVALVMTILVTLMGMSVISLPKDGSPEKFASSVEDAGASAVKLLVIVSAAVVTTFVAANWLMPKACHWALRH